MGLRFVIGRSGSGKSTFCLREIASMQEKEQDRAYIYIVPEQYSLQAERDIIKYTDKKGIMQAQVLSFQRLAYQVFSESGKVHKAVLDDTGKFMILRRVLSDISEQMEYFQKTLDKPGFLEKLSRTITEFRQYEVDREKIEALLGQMNEETPMKAKLRDLDRIVAQYTSYMGEHYISSDETLDILAKRAEESSLIRDAEIWIDGFYGFTPQEYNCLRKLLLMSRRVTVTLTMDEPSFANPSAPLSAPFFETMVTERKFRALAAETGCPIESPVILKKTKRFLSSALAGLEREYFHFFPKPVSSMGDVVVTSGINRYEEVEQIAEKILSLIADGMRYREIAVVTRLPEEYGRIFKKVFFDARIPCFIDVKKSIASFPLAELIKALLEMVQYHMPYESVFRFLKTGLSDLGQEEIDQLENYVLAYGIKGYRWNGPWKAGFFGDEEKKEKIEEIREKFLSPISDFLRFFSGKEEVGIQKLTEGLMDVLVKMHVMEKIEGWMEKFAAEGRLDKASEYKQCWEKLMNIFQRIQEILPEEQLTIGGFRKIFEAGVESCSLGVIPPGADQVIVGDIERTRLPEIKALFVAGVNDGILPSYKSAEGLFHEQERERLESFGLQLANNTKRQSFEERFLIYQGLVKPSKFLQISYAQGDLQGNVMRPSSLVKKIKQIFPDLSEWEEQELNGLSPNLAAHTLGVQMREYCEKGSIETQWMDQISFFSTDPRWKPMFDHLLSAMKEKNQEKRLKQEVLSVLYHKNLSTSVSRLERYANCPYAYFLQYSLKAKERKIYEIGAPDVGKLFHHVMEIFSKSIQDKALDWRKLERVEMDQMTDEAVETAAKELGDEVLYSTGAYRYLVRRLKRISKRAVWALSEHVKRGSFEPSGFEIGFGPGQTLPPIVIELDNGIHMILVGKIDRVDFWDHDGNRYVKIIDYKSGNKNFDLEEIYYGLQLQLMLYLEEYLRMGAQSKGMLLHPAGVFYFHITDPVLETRDTLPEAERENKLLQKMKMSGVVLSDDSVIEAVAGEKQTVSDLIPVAFKTDGSLKKNSSVFQEEEFEKLLHFVRKKAAQLGKEITEGNIQISPWKDKNKTACDYCPYSSICRFDLSFAGNRYRKKNKMDMEKMWQKFEEI